MQSIKMWLGCALLLLATTASAESVKNLYWATVPVSDQSEAALASASGDALGQVLVKLSGTTDALHNSVVQEAMSKARAQVQQYAYLREGPEQELFAKFKFDSNYISRLLSQANLPLWTSNRPRVLVWAAVEQNGQRRFINEADSPELSALLLAEFERRGVPVQIPLYDLRDATALSMEDVWALDNFAALQASQRYGIQDVLLGRVVELSSGEWSGDWGYSSAASQLERSAAAPEYLGYAREGVALVAEELSSRYAVAFSGAEDALVLMTVTGVMDYKDYAAIVDWLEGLELIDHANVQQVSGDRIELGLVSQADKTQLKSLLELNQRLIPQETVGTNLVYQWQN